MYSLKIIFKDSKQMFRKTSGFFEFILLFAQFDKEKKYAVNKNSFFSFFLKHFIF